MPTRRMETSGLSDEGQVPSSDRQWDVEEGGERLTEPGGRNERGFETSDPRRLVDIVEDSRLPRTLTYSPLLSDTPDDRG